MLASQRSSDYGQPAPIGVDDVRHYLEILRIDDRESREELLEYIVAMDRVSRKVLAAKLKESLPGSHGT